MFTLYAAAYSANARKPVALVRELALTPKIVEVDVYQGAGRSPAYLAVNPWGKVPTLVDGDLTLWESNAILVYIAEAHGEGRLWAADARGRAEIQRWLFWESAHWQPTLTEVLRAHAGHVMAPQYIEAPEGDPRWDEPQLVGLARHLEGVLTTRPFLAGEHLTLADVSVAGMTIFFSRLGFPFDDFPNLAAWYRRIHGRPAWRETNIEPWVPDVPPESSR